MSWFPTSDAASAQEILSSAVQGSVFTFAFLLENIFSLENGLCSNQFTYLTEIMSVFWLILKFKSICKISCCGIICMCNFPDQILQRFEMFVTLNSAGLFRFAYAFKK